MVFPIIVTVASLITLIVLHELGHFALAKRFDMKVEEFGVFFPPRLFAKKFGETVYSFNLLPLGAYVQIHGEDPAEVQEGETREEERIDPERSFAHKPAWQRALVLLGGVVMFWIVAAVLLGITSSAWGLPTSVSDSEEVRNPQVMVTRVVDGSPAAAADVTPLTRIESLEASGDTVTPTTMSAVQEFIQSHKKEEVSLTVRRQGQDSETFTVEPTEEGTIGIALARTGWERTPWYTAPIVGVEKTATFTYRISGMLVHLGTQFVSGEEVAGAEVRGPIGIGQLFVNAFDLGAGYFLYFLSVISIYLAIFNLLPIPAVDGGRLLFLGIEKIRGRPIEPRLEARVNATFFMLLLAVLLFVSIKDILRLLQ